MKPVLNILRNADAQDHPILERKFVEKFSYEIQKLTMSLEATIEVHK
jgi:hypothetical protein